ncbi:MAG: hypothetical protein AB8G96_07315 [Phycisphaerales bacterium]
MSANRSNEVVTRGRHGSTEGREALGLDVLPAVNLRPCCMDLRHKMMLCDDRQAVPGMTDDSSSTRVFWCAATQDALGPDGEPVDPDACGGGRHCFVAGPSARRGGGTVG